jgi:hypothetical protein
MLRKDTLTRLIDAQALLMVRLHLMAFTGRRFAFQHTLSAATPRRRAYLVTPKP